VQRSYTTKRKCDDVFCLCAPSIYFMPLSAAAYAWLKWGVKMRSSAWIDTSKHFAGAVVTGAQCPPGSHPDSGMHLRKQPPSKKVKRARIRHNASESAYILYEKMCVFSLWSNPLRNALPQSDLLLCCRMAFGRRVCAAVLTISSHSNHKNAPHCMAQEFINTEPCKKNDTLVYFLLFTFMPNLCGVVHGLYFYKRKFAVLVQKSHQIF
jgi:hypothetical protein